MKANSLRSVNGTFPSSVSLTRCEQAASRDSTLDCRKNVFFPIDHRSHFLPIVEESVLLMITLVLMALLFLRDLRQELETKRLTESVARHC